MNWNEKVKKDVTATEYLKQNYVSKTDKEISLILSELTGENVTRNAVRKARSRLNLRKGNIKNTSNSFEIVDTNNAEATGTASSLDELTRSLNIDMNIWVVKSFKTWQGFAKVNGEIATIPLMSASFVRKELIAIIPVVSPVVCDIQFDVPKPKYKKVKSELIFSDPHFGFKRDQMYSDKLIGFHDEKALGIVLQVAKKLQPEYIRILGDIFDFAEFSDKFIRSPEFVYLTQYTINFAHAFLLELRNTCPDSQIILHDGNHDKRLSDMIIKHIPFAYGLKPADEIELPPQLSVPRLLALHKLGIEYVDSYPNDFYVSDNKFIEYSHGQVARSKPYATVSNVVQNSDITKIVGHIHRIESASRTMWRGNQHRTIQAHSFGCTCRIDGSVPGRSSRQNWQQGFGIVRYTDDNYNISSYEIKDGETITEFGALKI